MSKISSSVHAMPCNFNSRVLDLSYVWIFHSHLSISKRDPWYTRMGPQLCCKYLESQIPQSISTGVQINPGSLPRNWKFETVKPIFWELLELSDSNVNMTENTWILYLFPEDLEASCISSSSVDLIGQLLGFSALKCHSGYLNQFPASAYVF